ncbi:MAG: response regulator [Treponemataceae bacterium]|nr:response regulator [Treponemataceae bacterium]
MVAASIGKNTDIPTIFIAEDSKVQAQALRSLLEHRGFQVFVAENGARALKILFLEPVHLVISDVVMPEMDGYALCRAIKNDEKLYHIPVILLTALSEPEDIIRGIESGADSFILKPYKEEFLFERIEAHLNGKIFDPADKQDVAFNVSIGGTQYSLNANRAQLFNLLIASYETSLYRARELERIYRELLEAQQRIASLEGILPMCGNCKRIRDEKGQWHPVEEFIEAKEGHNVSHGLCPDCAKKLLQAGS